MFTRAKLLIPLQNTRILVYLSQRDDVHALQEATGEHTDDPTELQDEAESIDR